LILFKSKLPERGIEPRGEPPSVAGTWQKRRSKDPIRGELVRLTSGKEGAFTSETRRCRGRESRFEEGEGEKGTRMFKAKRRNSYMAFLAGTASPGEDRHVIGKGRSRSFERLPKLKRISPASRKNRRRGISQRRTNFGIRREEGEPLVSYSEIG